jgi:hypothetical protein
MLMFLRGKASDRKLRLFAVACSRRIGHLLVDERSWNVVEILEQHAEGRIDYREVSAAVVQNYGFIQTVPPYTSAYSSAAAVAAAAGEAAWAAAWNVVSDARGALNANVGGSGTAEANQQAFLLRDIIGNPLRSVFPDPSWRHWQDGTLVKLAQALYDDHQFEDMPILGDALEEAGCTSEDILHHCRRPGAHVRGCWVVDLVLSKE